MTEFELLSFDGLLRLDIYAQRHFSEVIVLCLRGVISQNTGLEL